MKYSINKKIYYLYKFTYNLEESKQYNILLPFLEEHIIDSYLNFLSNYIFPQTNISKISQYII